MSTRVSATFKPTIARRVEQYSIFHGISKSEAIEILAASTALPWWESLSKKQKAELDKKYMEAK